MNANEQKFLQIVHDESIRPNLLVLLQDLELLSAFLLAESGTTPQA